MKTWLGVSKYDCSQEKMVLNNLAVSFSQNDKGNVNELNEHIIKSISGQYKKQILRIEKSMDDKLEQYKMIMEKKFIKEKKKIINDYSFI